MRCGQMQVRDQIDNWVWPPGEPRERSLGELLMHICDLLGKDIVPEGSISREPLTLDSPPAEVCGVCCGTMSGWEYVEESPHAGVVCALYTVQVKKAYIRAVRLVHPDKLVAGN